MSNNKELSILLSSMDERLTRAQSSEDILSIVQMTIDHNNPIKYDNKAMFFVSLTGVIGGVILWGALKTVSDYKDIHYILFLGVFLMVLVPLIVVFLRAGKIANLSADLFRIDSLLKNKIEKVDHNCQFSRDILDKFTEFRRGNYSQSIESLYASVVDNWRTYKYYNFHYVDKEIRKRTVSDGKGGTRTETEIIYHHYDRYGFIFPFEYANGLAVISNGQVPNKVLYEPSFIDFTKSFSIGACSEHDAAKYLKPSIQIMLVKLIKKYPNLNLEISVDGQMCMSFEDDILNEEKNEFSLSKPKEFYAELAATNKLVKFNELLNLHDELVRHWETNFKPK